MGTVFVEMLSWTILTWLYRDHHRILDQKYEKQKCSNIYYEAFKFYDVMSDGGKCI